MRRPAKEQTMKDKESSAISILPQSGLLPPPIEKIRLECSQDIQVRVYIHLILLVALSAWLIWSGIRAVRSKKAYFGKGYYQYTGKKAVILGYGWITVGVLLLLVGLIIIYR
jgi:hypothetical protein